MVAAMAIRATAMAMRRPITATVTGRPIRDTIGPIARITVIAMATTGPGLIIVPTTVIIGDRSGLNGARNR